MKLHTSFVKNRLLIAQQYHFNVLLEAALDILHTFYHGAQIPFSETHYTLDP